ncbi:MAG: CopD family protein [Bacteroidetes bacterium]|nr:CopD family protein [Bacteroidota bacterium]
MPLKVLILFHVLGACIWVGGHLVLALSVLPEALTKKDEKIILEFEKRFERIGIPALLIQVLTGLWMAATYVPIGEWFTFGDNVHSHISIKLLLLLLTFALALHARLFIIPRLTADTLPKLAWHIVGITFIAIGLLFVGLNFRLAYL